MGDERRGIGNRKQSGLGATWGGKEPTAPTEATSAQEKTTLWRGTEGIAAEEKTPPPGPMPAKPASLPARRPSQPTAAVEAAFAEKTPPPQPVRRPSQPQPAPPTLSDAAPGMSPLVRRLLALWGQVLARLKTWWTLLRDRVLRPGGAKLTQTWQELSAKVRKRFEDRTVEGDTFDQNRADQWEKFHKGKTSSSYLTKVDD